MLIEKNVYGRLADCNKNVHGIKINETQSANTNRVTVSVYLNSRESPRLLWLLTDAPLSDVLEGSPVRGVVVMHGGGYMV